MVQMMQNVHLAPETDEDDLYSGYNDYNPTYDTEELENDTAFQQAVRTNHGRRPPITAKIPSTAVTRPVATGYGSKTSLTSSMGRPVTGAIQDGVTRPMTAVRAAGFTKAALRGSAFDPLGQSRGPAPPLEVKNEDSPEEKIRQLEKKVNELVEESCIANTCGDLKLALEKAKDAGRKERVLVRQREQVTTPENINLDLTYSVLFNLASQYSANEMYAEALNTYQVIVKNKMFINAGRLKVNMGNIYLKQRNYSKAIKFYRMALDQIPSVHKEMRIKIMQNIGVTFIKTGQYSDAINSFEHIMSMAPNLKAGFNLILSYFAVGDREKMKKAFQKLIAVPLEIDEDDKYISPSDDPHTNLVIEAIKNDHLRQMERERKAMAEKYIMTAAKLIAPVIETSFAVGYDWCVEVVKASQYVELANDLEINKAITYLRQKDFNQAIETLKMFEKKDSRVKSAAATNLSFLYYLENDFAQASSYADLAVNSDRYNPSALTNKGNTVFANGDYEKAAEFYKEALRNDSSCTEALYNIGLTYKKLNRLDEALDCFLKLHAILRNSAQVLYQIANVYELMEDPNQAIEWLMQLISVVPTDSRALSKLGELYDSEGDKSQAFQYYYESYRYFPSNIEVIEWLGAYYIDTQFCEKAIQYFERAALIQPTQVKWQLMVASCFRRSGNYQKALDTYKDIHRKFPENVECLRFLVRLCTDIGLKEVQEYATKLKRLEKIKEIKEQRIKSGREGPGGSRGKREGSAGSDSGQNCSANSKGEQLSAKLRALPGTNEPYESSSHKEIDASYVDPLGPQVERPKTAAKKRLEEDDFADEELGDDLLPE
ncbi:intraflagellar transport protein 88 homolog isoform X1 [Pipistrellus kuhlii]|uniref:Intraflagellar transport protein 88 homolog n=2 Tax=Pipistrellus kuhlii TaxID=59472 RepID=A0A7J7ZIF1_PIPKU|nr:intraflagellar transport protein 88 homolog isoform X1 [Pipistrellus kuhlii]XP_045444475.1 intraflagellar transport protein 88 homolog isoform X1 [Pipistrellus kuhlii]KAF6373889.1 intraflagellar transport 88 [Pipistrellus kuhlii]